MSHKKRPAKAQAALLTKTLELLDELNNNGLSYLQIFEGTGLHPEWTAKLKQRKIPDPSVNRIEVLFNFLQAHKSGK